MDSVAVRTSARWWALATIALGVSLVIMDATVVNVATPVVIRELGLDVSQAEWINAVYALMLASLLLTLGRVGDLYGRRLLFGAGTSTFMLASVVAGLSAGGGALIGARAVQGVGAAMILTSTLSTLNALFHGRERAIAFAVWGATIGGMAAVGPLVGGWLTTDVTWRWAFWLNVPFGVLVLVGILRSVPETRAADARVGFDIAGAVLSALGMGAVVFGLIEGESYGWWRGEGGGLSPVPVVLAAGVVLVAVFVIRTLRRARAGRTVLVDVHVAALPTYRYGALAALIVAFGEFGLLFTLPLLLQNALGYTALGTGLLILALALGTFLVSGATAQLTARIGSRAVVRIGLGLESLSVAGLALTLADGVSSWVIAGWLFGYGVGVGMATAQLTSVVLHDVPLADSGEASGLLSTIRQLGSALGVAVLGSILVSTLAVHTERAVAALGLPSDVTDPLVQAVRSSVGAVVPGLRADPATAAVGEAARGALVDASVVVTLLAAAIIGVGLLATLLLPRPSDRGPAEVSSADGAPAGGALPEGAPGARAATADRPAGHRSPSSGGVTATRMDTDHGEEAR
jgi:EmrB/QacA subfamily drug resistance transporter